MTKECADKRTAYLLAADSVQKNNLNHSNDGAYAVFVGEDKCIERAIRRCVLFSSQMKWSRAVVGEKENAKPACGDQRRCDCRRVVQRERELLLRSPVWNFNDTVDPVAYEVILHVLPEEISGFLRRLGVHVCPDLWCIASQSTV